MPPGAGEFEQELATKVLGRPLRHLPFSVTAEALALAWARKEEAPEGATVVVDQELSPRQRKGPPWIGFSTDGLYFSVVLRPGIAPEGEGLLWLLASLGVAEGLQEATGLEVSLKWPDDVIVAGKKIAGMKVDALLGPGEIQIAVITCRLNLNVSGESFPAGISEASTSVLIETGKKMSRRDALEGILRGLEARYDSSVPELLDSYRARCETIGRMVRARLLPKGEVMGKASGVSDFGTLLINVGGKPVPVVIDTLRRLEYT